MSKNSTDVIRKPLGALNKKPFANSSCKFQKVLTNSKKKEAGQEQRYTKKGSGEIAVKWSKTFKRTHEPQQVERQKTFTDKAQEKERPVRREKIIKAHELLQKLKPDVKENQSAATVSERPKPKTAQRSITKELEDTLKKKDADDKPVSPNQGTTSIETEHKRISHHNFPNNQYQVEATTAAVKDNLSIKKAEQYKNDLTSPKNSQNTSNQEIKAQIEKEQEMLKRKREALRKNALEAMIMVEQRKAREQNRDNAEGNLIPISNININNNEVSKKTSDLIALEDRVNRNMLHATNFRALQSPIREVEEKRLCNALSTNRLQFTAQEQEKVERSRQQKYARIQEYFRELNAQKERKQRKSEEPRVSSLANHFKNDKCYSTFDHKRWQEMYKTAQQARKFLPEEIEKLRLVNEEKKEIPDAQIGKKNQLLHNTDETKTQKPCFIPKTIDETVQGMQQCQVAEVGCKSPQANIPTSVKTLAPPMDPEKEVKSPVSSAIIVHKYTLEELRLLNPYSTRSQ